MRFYHENLLACLKDNLSKKYCFGGRELFCQRSQRNQTYSPRIGKMVTVQAPVKSATMLYRLYENIDRDPRVKFKF